MAKPKEIENKVRGILIDFPEARGNDFVLYARYIQRYNAELQGVGLLHALLEASQLHMPNYESITRARRKIQQTTPELCPPERKRKARADEEVVYRMYAREQ